MVPGGARPRNPGRRGLTLECTGVHTSGALGQSPLRYVLKRLSQLGIDRIRGAALLSTTYGVGELSAINGVMGSKAHRLTVFHLVGMPSERIQRLGLVTHHNLGDTVYDRFQSISASACCVTAVLTPDNCVDELERVIREALRQSMPAYIVISELHGNMPIGGTPVVGKPIGSIKRQHSVQAELDAAVGTVLSRLAAAKVGTNAELDAVLTKIASEDAAAYVEVMIPNEESQPMPKAVVDLGYKLQTPPVG